MNPAALPDTVSFTCMNEGSVQDYALLDRKDWDQRAFDPEYPTRPLSYFEPMLRGMFSRKEFDSNAVGPSQEISTVSLSHGPCSADQVPVIT